MSGLWLTKARDRLLRPLVILLILNAAGFLVYTLPRTLQERSLAARAEALAADVDHERRNIGRLQERAAVIRLNAQETTLFYKGLSDQAELVSTLKELDKTAPSVGARSYHPDDVKGADVNRFVVTMPVSGSYADLLAFLKAIENSKQFITIDRLSMREREAAADLDVEMSIYFRGALGPRRSGTRG